jgi:hypothetical protein
MPANQHIQAMTMNTINNAGTFRSLPTAAIVGALALGSAVANAEDSRGARSITVKFADLKVSTPEGAAALYGRLRGRQ